MHFAGLRRFILGVAAFRAGWFAVGYEPSGALEIDVFVTSGALLNTWQSAAQILLADLKWQAMFQ